MKQVKIGNIDYRIAEHKGDISYNNYVKFKQYVPQFWEKMDSPMFEVYWEKVQDLFNQSKFIQAYNVMLDYRMALNNSKNSYDAWGICFALICYKEGEDIHETKADDEIKKFLSEVEITPDIVVENVVNFMRASPETFQDHLALYAVLGTMIETDI